MGCSGGPLEGHGRRRNGVDCEGPLKDVECSEEQGADQHSVFGL